MRAGTKEKNLTSVIRETVQVHLHREIVAIFRGNDIWAVFSFQYLLRTIFHQLIEAFDLDRNEDLGFGFWSRDMEGYPIEIRHSLVDIDGRGTGRGTVRGVRCGNKSGGSPRKSLSQNRLNQDILVV
jgi:hypothetical protein